MISPYKTKLISWLRFTTVQICVYRFALSSKKAFTSTATKQFQTFAVTSYRI